MDSLIRRLDVLAAITEVRMMEFRERFSSRDRTQSIGNGSGIHLIASKAR
ncbi:MAG: hypothetical protein ABR905_15995 [Terracidiphilus sp.]